MPRPSCGAKWSEHERSRRHNRYRGTRRDRLRAEIAVARVDGHRKSANRLSQRVTPARSRLRCHWIESGGCGGWPSSPRWLQRDPTTVEEAGDRHRRGHRDRWWTGCLIPTAKTHPLPPRLGLGNAPSALCRPRDNVWRKCNAGAIACSPQHIVGPRGYRSSSRRCATRPTGITFNTGSETAARSILQASA